MKRFFYCLFFISFPLTFLTAQTDQEFLKYFKKVKTIQLDEKAPIKVILQLDVDKSGQILVSDVGGETFLFSPDGKLIKGLNSDECSPGMKWKLPRAAFLKSGEILKYDFLQQAVLFKNNGSCLKKSNSKNFGSTFFSSFLDGSVIYYNSFNMKDISPFTICDKDGKELIKFGTILKEFPNASIYLSSKGGMTVDDNDIIYQAFFNNAQINKYDRTGKFLGSIFRKPDRYILLRNDMPKIDINRAKANDQQYVAEMDKYFVEYTYVDALYILDNSLIMLAYTYKEETGLQIFNTGGNYLLNNDLKLDKKTRIGTAKNGCLYFISKPDIKNYNDNSSNYNPRIEVYKYIGKTH